MATVPAIKSDHFRGGRNLNKGSKSGENVYDLEELISAIRVDILALEATQEGSAAAVTLIQAGQPSNTDTLDVGADTYQFLTTPAGATSDIEVEIGANAEATLDNLLAATVAYGTESLYWDKLAATQLRLRTATASRNQGTITGADPSIVLDASGATNYSFDVGDVNMNTLAGITSGLRDYAAVTLTITTAMITATLVRISFPFTPRTFVFTATSSDVPVAFTADTIEISGDDILLGLGTDLANGDVLNLVAYA